MIEIHASKMPMDRVRKRTVGGMALFPARSVIGIRTPPRFFLDRVPKQPIELSRHLPSETTEGSDLELRHGDEREVWRAAASNPYLGDRSMSPSRTSADLIRELDAEASLCTKFALTVGFTGHMGDNLGPNGLSIGSNTRVSRSKYPSS